MSVWVGWVVHGLGPPGSSCYFLSLPVLFRFVPALGPELGLLGTYTLQVDRLDIFRVYPADRLDLMDDLIRHPASGLVTQPVPDPPASHSHEHRERPQQISCHRS